MSFNTSFIILRCYPYHDFPTHHIQAMEMTLLTDYGQERMYNIKPRTK